MYFFYGEKELEYLVLYQGNSSRKTDDITSKHVSLLGRQGWEAINVMRREDGMEHWYFKRRIHPGNQYF